MKKLDYFLLLCFLITGNVLFAQLILPQFNSVEKQTTFSSNQEEGNPFTVNNGTSIFYNRYYFEGDGENSVPTGQEIRYSTQGKKGWIKPYRLLTEDDLPGENLIVGTNKTGTRIYVFNSLPGKDTLYRKLYYLNKTEKKYEWSAPTEVIIPGLEFGNDFLQFYVNPEETAFLISKTPQDKISAVDIFVSLKDENGNWDSIINLGRTINSNRIELASFITNDLKTIYFSSDGHGGYGSSDIFVSMRLDESWQKWTKPLNLGEPINSVDYDASFMMANANEIYFASDRGAQLSDIYKGTFTGEVVLAKTDSLKGVFIHNGKTVQGIVLVVTDSKGYKVAEVKTDEKGTFKFEKLKGEDNYLVKMEEEDSDFVGSKIYFLNEEENKTDRYVYTKEGLFVNSKDLESYETVQGVFNYNSLPGINIGLVIVDENGFPLDTVYTDENGNFSYSVLKMEGGFTVIPLNMTEDEFVNVDMYLIDEIGNKLETLKPNEFHALQKEDDTLVGKSTFSEDSLVEVDIKDNSNRNNSAPNIVYGVYKYKSLPAEQSGLIMLDQNGFPVDTIYTFNEGNFSYSFLSLEERFSIVPLNMTEDEFINTDIYLTDKEGKRWITLLPGQVYFLELDGNIHAFAEDHSNRNSNDSNTINGVYNYKSLPAIQSGLIIMDQKGFPVDTIYTDKEGQFSYSFISLVEGFSIVPLNMTEEEFINTVLYLTDKEGRRWITLKPDQVYLLELDGDNLELIEYNSDLGIDLENAKGSQQEITAWNSGSPESKIIYFEFEETKPKKGESNKLSMLVSLVKLDRGVKIILTGHTDDSGEETANYSYGLARAAYVRTYLVSQGVPTKNIEVISKGELAPQADNTVQEGRMKNRRVEIRVK